MNLDSFFKEMHIKPKNVSIYETAFTHASYNSDANTSHKDYERLEFIGDSFVGMIVADLAYNLHPELDQGQMSKLKAGLVQAQALKQMAIRFNMQKYVRVGNSLKNVDLVKMPHLLEDIFEAVVGAIYIDQGLNKTYNLIRKLFYNEVKNFDFSKLHDYKTKLQEYVQADTRKAVEYKVINEKGPSHDKTFEVEVLFNNIVLGKGIGKSKKEAEQNAARDALNKFKY